MIRLGIRPQVQKLGALRPSKHHNEILINATNSDLKL